MAVFVRKRMGWIAPALALLVSMLGVSAIASSALAAARAPRANSPNSVLSLQRADSVPGVRGLPTGVPPAATAAPAELPVPPASEWPFRSDFSHTEGTGRLEGGATLWTDFVYDDHGPAGSPLGIAQAGNASDLAPVRGGFTYPTGAADQNGADIFTAAIGYTRKATYWRVDWNTLADPKVPVAEWTMSVGNASGAPATRPPGPATRGSPRRRASSTR